MRRNLYQEAKGDVRKFAGQQKKVEQQPVQECVQPVVGDWRARLQKVCELAHVSRVCEAAASAAERLGVALDGELKDVAAEIAQELDMTMLERRRFMTAFGGEAVAAKAVALPVTIRGYDSEDDSFPDQEEPDEALADRVEPDSQG